ncbi:TniQ family protein [Pseudomonas yamanorum]|uniref:TniQ family protein n=1 Tax=Pseudomonas yamanorum TaxID=515393 RepID=UPI001C4515C1|nr:TniQ family protein [Pseudomonas yamanorum]MBV6659806.1 TniQ family protein [Pseudomonas yamanorum]
MHPDETISSWICRSIDFFHYGVGPAIPEHVKNLIVERVGAGDFDYGYDHRDLEMLATWRRDSASQAAVVSLDGINLASRLRPEQRIQFCPSCVIEDLRSWRTPIWRHQWGSLYYAVCEKHFETLRSLSGTFNCTDIFQRGSQASRCVIDSISESSEYTRLTDANEFLLDAQPFIEKAPYAAITQLMVALCLRVQGDISDRMNKSEFIQDGYLRALTDMYRVMLRAHRRGTESIPFCFHIADKLKKTLYLPSLKKSYSVNEMLTGYKDRLDPHSRMVALALLGVIFNNSESEHAWSEIADLFNSYGVLMPKSPSVLFGLVTGAQEIGIRNWIASQSINIYPETIGNRLLELDSRSNKFINR